MEAFFHGAQAPWIYDLQETLSCDHYKKILTSDLLLDDILFLHGTSRFNVREV
jgi:hypothetical protein